MKTAWRIVQAQVAEHAFTGEGARRYGGRWNSKGVAVVYASGSLSLAILEVLVHLPAYHLLQQYVCIPVRFDPKLVRVLQPAELPDSWNTDPSPQANRQIGDNWAEGRQSAVLEVPSAVVPTEKNYLINPAHPDFPKLAIGKQEKLPLDPRLMKS